MNLDDNYFVSTKPKILISFDFELGWGAVNNGLWKQRESKDVYKKLHSIFPKLLNILESNEITVDWATVGALGMNPRDLELSHLPSSYAALVSNFIENADDDTKDGRQLFESLIKTRYQNLISHSLTHIVLNREDLGDEGRLLELEATRQLLIENGYSGSALVFPENQSCDNELLKAVGIRDVRVSPEYHRNPYIGNLQKIFYPPSSGVSNSVPREHRGSTLYQPRNQKVINKLLFHVQNHSIRASLRMGRPLCLWLHPFNFGIYPSLLSDFEKLMTYLARLRDSGTVVVGSMENE